MSRSGSAVSAAVVVALLPACGSMDEPVAVPASVSPGPAQTSAQPAPVASVSTRILVRLDGRSGPWQATLGDQGDQGDLTIRYRCTGGGDFVVDTRRDGETVKTESPCDGVTRLTKGWTAGPLTVQVQAEDAQRWSLLVVRGPEQPGDYWPEGAREVEP